MKNYLIALGVVALAPAALASVELKEEDIKKLQAQLKEEQENTERAKQANLGRKSLFNKKSKENFKVVRHK
jgi:hypothetical protein